MTDFEGLQTQEVAKNLPQRMLGRFGLVYGEGMSEYGLKHVGMGIPLHRRATLEANLAAAQNMMAIVEDAQARPTDEV
jgi:hypothetical protein